MARVFTISFLHKYEDHTAVVTISDAGSTLSIYVPDESLHNIFPDGKVSIGKDGIPINEKDLPLVRELIASMMKAIEIHKYNNPNFHL